MPDGNTSAPKDTGDTGLPAWAPYDQSAEPYLDLGDAVQVKHHLLKAQLDFLEQAQQRRQQSQ